MQNRTIFVTGWKITISLFATLFFTFLTKLPAYSLEAGEAILFKKIAVLDFEDKDKKYSEMTGDLIRDILQKGYPHKIVSKALTTDLLAKEGIKIKYPVTSKDAIRIGKALNADAIITGSINASDMVTLSAQIHDTKEGKVFAIENFQEKGETEARIKRGAQALAYKLINRIPYKGIIAGIEGKNYTIDAGKNQGIVKGTVMSVYEIIGIKRHPFLEDVISVDRAEIGALIVTDAGENSSMARIKTLKAGREIRVNNKIDYKPVGEIISVPIDAAMKVEAPKATASVTEAGKYSADEVLTFNKILPFGFIDKTGKKYDKAVEGVVRYIFETLYPFKIITASEPLVKKELDAKGMAIVHPLPQDTGALIGKISGADAIVTGSIETVNTNTRIFIQLISGKTGEPLFYEEEVIIGPATMAIVRDVARKVANRLADKIPYKSVVTKKADEYVYLDVGKKHGVQNGAILPLFKIVKISRDPATNEIKSVDKRMLGEVIVIDAKDYTSTAKMYSKILGEKIDVGAKVMFEPVKEMAVAVLPQMEDVKTEEKAASAPAPLLKQRIYGDLSTGYNYTKTANKDSGVPDYIYNTLTTRLNLNALNLLDTNLSLFFDGNEREDLRYSKTKETSTTAKQHQYSITTLYMLYQNLFGRLDTYIGRHSVPEGAVYIDGGQLRFNFTPRFRVGAFGGLRSNINDYEADSNYKIYGVYSGYQGDILNTTLSYVHIFHKACSPEEGKSGDCNDNFDRGYANLQVYLTPTPYLRFNIYLTEDLNFHYKDEETFDTTNFYLSGTYNPIPDITLSLVYSMFEPNKNFTDDPTFYKEYHEHRYEARGSYRFFRFYNIDASAGYQRRQEGGRNSLIYSAGLGNTNFFNTEIQWNFRFTLNRYNRQPESDTTMHPFHTNSEVYFFSMGRSLFNRLYIDGRYTHQYTKEHHDTYANRTAMTAFGGTLTANLPYNIYSLFTYEHTKTKSDMQGASTDMDSFYTQVGVRF
ncbi:MAG: hypothetical protein HY034_04590 [Nitrospirae bacterium]|nr:hypothetical protein [Nitrospirota bacterium]